MIPSFLAHSEGLHDTSTSNFEHLITTGYVAVPLFLLFLLGVYFAATRLMKWQLPQTLLIIMAITFIIGVLSFSVTPVVSVVSITIGMGLALFFTLTAL